MGFKVQPDLFPEPPPPRATAAALREEEHFGRMDARTGLSLPSDYSRGLSGELLEAYTRGFRAERARQIEAMKRTDLP